MPSQSQTQLDPPLWKNKTKSPTYFFSIWTFIGFHFILRKMWEVNTSLNTTEMTAEIISLWRWKAQTHIPVTWIWLVWLFKWTFLLHANSSTHFDQNLSKGIPEQCIMVTTVFSLAFLQISCTQNGPGQFGLFSICLLGCVVNSNWVIWNQISLACCIYMPWLFIWVEMGSVLAWWGLEWNYKGVANRKVIFCWCMFVHLDKCRIQRRYEFIQSQRHGWRYISKIRVLKFKFLQPDWLVCGDPKLYFTLYVNVQRQEEDSLQELPGTWWKCLLMMALCVTCHLHT